MPKANKLNKNILRSRLHKNIDPLTAEFISSLEEDKRITEIDINVVEAHTLMLRKQRIISESDSVRILKALEKTRVDFKNNNLIFDPKDIDIHPAIERNVIKLCGLDIGGKVHLAKSRNDQVMTDIHIYLRNETIEIIKLIQELVNTLIKLASKYRKVVMPGYTHTQYAQTTTYGHYLLSYTNEFINDINRLFDGYTRLNLSPLGACAFAGTSIDIDREYSANLLGFDGIIENAIYATSGRDVILEIAANFAIPMSTLSRMAGDIILWSTSEFNMVELSDEFADISTAMPQKKNPDPLELIRARAAKSFSGLNEIFATIKGLTTGYHRDFQQLKEPLWKQIEILKSSIILFRRIIENLEIKKDKMLENVIKNHITSLDLAERLTMETNLSFRESYILVGKVVKEAIKKGSYLSEVNSEYIANIAKRTFNKKILFKESKLKEAVDPIRSINSRISRGGPSSKEMERMIVQQKKIIKELKDKLLINKKKIELSERKLKGAVSNILKK